MSKPKFNTYLPYEVVEDTQSANKPAFNPSLPYEEVKEDTKKAPVGTWGYVGKGAYDVPGLTQAAKKIAEKKAAATVFKGLDYSTDLTRQALSTGVSLLPGISKEKSKKLRSGWKNAILGPLDPTSDQMFATTSDRMGDLGWNPEGTAGKITKGIVGFAGDVASTPSSLLSLGSKIPGVMKGLQVLKKGGEKAFDVWIKGMARATDMQPSSVRKMFTEAESLPFLTSPQGGEAVLGSEAKKAMQAIDNQEKILFAQSQNPNLTPLERARINELRAENLSHKEYFLKSQNIPTEKTVTKEVPGTTTETVVTNPSEMPAEIIQNKKIQLGETGSLPDKKGPTYATRQQARTNIDTSFDAAPGSRTSQTRQKYAAIKRQQKHLAKASPKNLSDKDFELITGENAYVDDLIQEYKASLIDENTGKSVASPKKAEELLKNIKELKKMEEKVALTEYNNAIKEVGTIQDAGLKEIDDRIKIVKERYESPYGSDLDKKELDNLFASRKAYEKTITTSSPFSTITEIVYGQEPVQLADTESTKKLLLRTNNRKTDTKAEKVIEDIDNLPGSETDLKHAAETAHFVNDMGNPNWTPTLLRNWRGAGAVLGAASFGQLPGQLTALAALGITSPRMLKKTIQAINASKPAFSLAKKLVKNPIQYAGPFGANIYDNMFNGENPYSAPKQPVINIGQPNTQQSQQDYDPNLEYLLNR